MAGCDFSCTIDAVKELGRTLICSLCQKRFCEPVEIGRCAHVFCKKCITGCCGNECPICHVPVAAKDSHSELQISVVLNLCEQLQTYLFEGEWSGENNTDTENVNGQEMLITPKRGEHVSLHKAACDKFNDPKEPQDPKSMESPSGQPATYVADKGMVSSNCETPPTLFSRTSLRSSSLYSPPSVSRTRDVAKKCRERSSTQKFKDKRNVKGETLLHVAAIKDNLAKVEELLKKGADPNVKDNAGWTPLHEASNRGFKEIVRCLLDYGANVNVPSHDNITPLHDAVLNNQIEVAQYLASRGGDLHARTSQGFTVLDFCLTAEIQESLMNAALLHITEPSTSVSLKKSPVGINGKIVFLPTGLSDAQKENVVECAQLLDAQIVEEFSKEVTHVIASCDQMGQCNRTLKVLQGILAGKWIMNFHWIELCLEYKQKVDEEIYEVPGTKQQKDTRGPRRARQNALQQFPPLFDGCNFYLYGQFSAPSPTREDICSLIQQGGGKILLREPKPSATDMEQLTVPYHASSCTKLSDTSYFILYQYQPPREVHLSTGPVRTVNIFWLIDSISTFSLLDPDKVDIPKVNY